MEHQGQQPFSVFISHRGIDTKKTFIGLLEHWLHGLGITAFVDWKSMKPGENLSDRIQKGIRQCKVGVAVLSPHYCESRSCLRELALMLDCRNKFFPIFWDVEPAELQLDPDLFADKVELQEFNNAIKVVKNTVGLVFNSRNGDWSEFLTKATDAIVEALEEGEENHNYDHGLFENLAPITTFICQFQSYIRYTWKVVITIRKMNKNDNILMSV
ncbi:hypothetical protein Ancab_033795 [Ancistrocladus abbreviatus]